MYLIILVLKIVQMKIKEIMRENGDKSFGKYSHRPNFKTKTDKQFFVNCSGVCQITGNLTVSGLFNAIYSVLSIR